MITPNAKAKAVLDSIAYITVATTDRSGQPWNTPVAGFHFDDDYILYWASWAENQHSKNIRDNDRVFVVVYDSTPADAKPSAGVYLIGKAKELTDEQEVMRAALVFKDDQFNPSDGTQYIDQKPRRIYKFIPSEIWMNSDSEVQGNFVDTRIKADS